MGGCGTLSGSANSQSTLLASPSLAPAVAVSTDPQGTLRPVAEPVAAAVPAETRGETGEIARPAADDLAAAAKPDFVPVALEPITPAQSPASLIAFDGPLVSQAAPADPTLAQKRGTPEPIPDVQIEEYDPW